MGIKENVIGIRDLIQKNCLKVERNPSKVKLLPVTKTRSIQEIKELVTLGFREFGENKIQELLSKAKQLSGIKWHFIGNIQSNKVKKIVELSEVIHSINSKKILLKANEKAKELNKIQKIFIEVNTSGEKTKHGASVEEAKELIGIAKKLENIELLGLMTMAPFVEPEKTRIYFKKLKMLANEFGLKELSMGMSNDFEIAVQEGSTLVRIGTKIFE